MKVAITSDLHGNLPDIEPCDLLLICGDIVGLYDQTNCTATKTWMKTEFEPWCEKQNTKKVIFIAGNHDWAFEKEELYYKNRYHKDNFITYLCNDSITYNGLNIYGTPNCHLFGNWAFMKGDYDLKQIFGNIPNGLDILLTHDMALGKNDIITQKAFDGMEENHVGHSGLTKAIKRVKPRYHFSGHIHSAPHTGEKIGSTQSYAVSLLDEYYSVKYPVLYLDIEPKKEVYNIDYW